MPGPARPPNDVVLERNVPMRARDGVTLRADVWRPDGPGRFPVILSRTPYGKDTAARNPNGSNAFFARHGYVTVIDRNLNTGAPFGEGIEMVAARQTVFHRSDMASFIVLPVIQR